MERSKRRSLNVRMRDMAMTMEWTRQKLAPQCDQRISQRTTTLSDNKRERAFENEGSTMHDDSSIGINYVYAHTQVFLKCFKSLHTSLGFALCFVSSILILVAVTIYSILTWSRIPCGIHTAKTGLLRCCLYTSVGCSRPPSAVNDPIATK